MLMKINHNALFYSFISLLRCMSITQFIALDDLVIWNAGINRTVGMCSIDDARQNSNVACNYYAKSNYQTFVGLPNNVGNGCMCTSLSSCPTCLKGYDACSACSNLGYNGMPFCESDHIKNGANLIRIGTINGFCDVSNFAYSTVNNSSQNSSTQNSTEEIKIKIQSAVKSQSVGEINILSLLSLFFSVLALVLSVVTICMICCRKVKVKHQSLYVDQPSQAKIIQT